MKLRPYQAPRKQPKINDMIYPPGSRQGGGNVWIGGIMMNVPQPSSGPVVSPSPTPTKTLTPTPTPSVTATITPSVTPTNTGTPTPTPTPTNTQTPTPSVTATITPSVTPTNTVTPSITPTNTVTPSITPSSTPPASGTTEANTYLSAVVSAGGTGITSTVSAATRTLFTSLVSNGLYNKIIAMYPLLGENSAGCKFNAVNPIDTNGGYRLTYTGGMSFNSSGETGNGSNAYADTFINQTTAPSVRTLGIYSLTTQDTGVDIGNNDSYLITKLGGTGYFQLGGGGTTSQPSSTGQGLYIGVFTGTPTITLYKNGSFVSSNNVGSTSFGTRNLLLSANNNSGGVDNYCPRTHGFAFFATSLTSSEVSTLSTIINTWATTIGRNTY